MQSSRRDLNSERKDATNQERIISQQEQRRLVEHGENKIETEVEFAPMSSGSSDELEITKPPISDDQEIPEVDRPDLELNYQGNSLVIDLDPLEWIALVILIVIGAWLLHQP